MKVSVSDLIHHPMNGEIYPYHLLMIYEFHRRSRLLQNLVINKKNQVLSGNRRLEAIRRLGWDTVEVEVVSSDAEEHLIVHFNKQRVKTCKELLNEFGVLLPYYKLGKGKRTDLTSVPENTGGRARDNIAEVMGVSSSQIGKLLFIQKTDPHYIDLLDEGIRTVSQAYLTVSRIKNQQERLSHQAKLPPTHRDDFVFHNKSSHQMEEVLDKSVDLIFTSPPYWNKRNYVDGGGLGNEKTHQEFVSNLVEHLKDCQRVLKPEGSFFLVLGDTFHNGQLLSIPHRVVLGLQEQGWILRNTIVWKKTNPKPSSSKSNLTQTYEFIFHLWVT